MPRPPPERGADGLAAPQSLRHGGANLPEAEGWHAGFTLNVYDRKLAAAYQRGRATSGDGVLGIGDVGPDVAGLQRALQRYGFPAMWGR